VTLAQHGGAGRKLRIIFTYKEAAGVQFAGASPGFMAGKILNLEALSRPDC
jgi:hypothetical protein